MYTLPKSRQKLNSKSKLIKTHPKPKPLNVSNALISSSRRKSPFDSVCDRSSCSSSSILPRSAVSSPRSTLLPSVSSHDNCKSRSFQPPLNTHLIQSRHFSTTTSPPILLPPRRQIIVDCATQVLNIDKITPNILNTQNTPLNPHPTTSPPFHPSNQPHSHTRAENHDDHNDVHKVSTFIMEGHSLADSILDQVHSRSQYLQARIGRAPTLCVVLVGNRPDSLKYVSVKKKSAEQVGIATLVEHLDDSCTQEMLLSTISRLNVNNGVDGIIVQLPLPPHLDASTALQHVQPTKDVDGFHLQNQVHLMDEENVNTEAFTNLFPGTSTALQFCQDTTTSEISFFTREYGSYPYSSYGSPTNLEGIEGEKIGLQFATQPHPQFGSAGPSVVSNDFPSASPSVSSSIGILGKYDDVLLQPMLRDEGKRSEHQASAQTDTSTSISSKTDQEEVFHSPPSSSSPINSPSPSSPTSTTSRNVHLHPVSESENSTGSTTQSNPAQPYSAIPTVLQGTINSSPDIVSTPSPVVFEVISPLTPISPQVNNLDPSRLESIDLVESSDINGTDQKGIQPVAENSTQHYSSPSKLNSHPPSKTQSNHSHHHNIVSQSSPSNTSKKSLIPTRKNGILKDLHSTDPTPPKQIIQPQQQHHHHHHHHHHPTHQHHHHHHHNQQHQFPNHTLLHWDTHNSHLHSSSAHPQPTINTAPHTIDKNIIHPHDSHFAPNTPHHNIHRHNHQLNPHPPSHTCSATKTPTARDLQQHVVKATISSTHAGSEHQLIPHHQRQHQHHVHGHTLKDQQLSEFPTLTIDGHDDDTFSEDLSSTEDGDYHHGNAKGKNKRGKMEKTLKKVFQLHRRDHPSDNGATPNQSTQSTQSIHNFDQVKPYNFTLFETLSVHALSSIIQYLSVATPSQNTWQLGYPNGSALNPFTTTLTPLNPASLTLPATIPPPITPTNPLLPQTTTARIFQKLVPPVHALPAPLQNQLRSIELSIRQPYQHSLMQSLPKPSPLLPCTPLSCIALLDFYNINLVGAHVVVLGRSSVVGFPLSLMLMQRGAIVTNLDKNCPDSTRKNLTKSADIIVTAVGKAHFIDKKSIKKGCVIIDVGINFISKDIAGERGKYHIELPPRKWGVKKTTNTQGTQSTPAEQIKSDNSHKTNTKTALPSTSPPSLSTLLNESTSHDPNATQTLPISPQGKITASKQHRCTVSLVEKSSNIIGSGLKASFTLKSMSLCSDSKDEEKESDNDGKNGKKLKNHRLVGDVDFDNVLGYAGMITPVPGGVGPVTVAMLMRNTVLACSYHCQQRILDLFSPHCQQDVDANSMLLLGQAGGERQLDSLPSQNPLFDNDESAQHLANIQKGNLLLPQNASLFALKQSFSDKNSKYDF